MTKRNKNKGKHGGKSRDRDEVERKRDERGKRNALKKEREAKEYLENDENFVSFSNQLQAMGYKIKDIKGDGNCLFRALADQLEGDDMAHLRLRRNTVKYLTDHQEEFEPFVEDDKSFDDHVKQLSTPGTYGGNDSIVAFSRHHGVDVVIHQLNERCWVIQGHQYSTSKHGENIKELHISYHNGDHYSSVRRIGDPDDGPAWMFNVKHKVKGVPLQSGAKGQNSKKKESTKKDAEACCKGAEALSHESSDIAVVRAATGCQDTQMILQTLCESGNDINVTISYILQIQTIMDVEKPDDGNISSSELSRKVDEINDIDAEHQDEAANLKLTNSSDSSVEKNSQQVEREFVGARPKVKQQNLGTKKRKQLAKQEKKTRRMEERQEEAKQRRDPQNLDNHEANQTIPVVGDLDALTI